MSGRLSVGVGGSWLLSSDFLSVDGSGRSAVAGVGKCCESGESRRQELPAECGGGKFEPGPPRMASESGGDRKDF